MPGTTKVTPSSISSTEARAVSLPLPTGCTSSTVASIVVVSVVDVSVPEGGVGPREQVAQGAPLLPGEPDPPPMLGPIAKQVASLAKRLQVPMPAPAV